MTINGTEGWISFKDGTPATNQVIEVHTHSDLYLETIYHPLKDLEGICDAWRPV